MTPVQRLGWLMTAWLLAACTAVPASPGSPALAADKPATLTVFAAASLTEAFTELGREFEREHGQVRVQFNFAGSQQLAQQLAQGAPADVFASANQAQIDGVIASGRVVSGTAQTFAGNALVAIYPAEGAPPLLSLADLARPGLRLVLAAKEVPAGQYTLIFLDKASASPEFGPKYREAVLANVVSYEASVRAVLGKVALGEADAGIVYITDAVGTGGKGVGRTEIPQALNPLASYPIAPVADSAHAALAREFIDLVLGPRGQGILAKYGFVAR